VVVVVASADELLDDCAVVLVDEHPARSTAAVRPAAVRTVRWNAIGDSLV
jgi:hypothetical protein